MFEIPDDDDEFWENLPLGEDLPQFLPKCPEKPSVEKANLSTESKPSSIICRRDLQSATGFISSHDSPVIPCAQKPDQHSSGLKNAQICGNKSTERAVYKPNDLFNLTQSSADSDFDLSLNSDYDVGQIAKCQGQGQEKVLPEANTLDGAFGGNININSRMIDPSSARHPVKNFVANTGSHSDKMGNNARSTYTSTCITKQFPCAASTCTTERTVTGSVNRGTPNIGTSSQSKSLRTSYFSGTSTLNSVVNNSFVGVTQHKMPSSVSMFNTPTRRTQEVRVERESPFSTNCRAKRKFPGPAGLLPKLAPGQSLDTSPVLLLNSPRPEKKEDLPIPSSQSSEDAFSEAAWRRLEEDLGEDCFAMLQRFSVGSTLSKARQKQLPQGKVPMLFAVVEILDIHGADGSVVLRDKTGRMQGTVHRELLKESPCQLHQGAVIVLKQVGVISPTSRTHYLNITPSNVISVYRTVGDGTATVSYNEFDVSLLSQIQAVETQLRDTPAAQTPKLGQLLSQPQTPIGRVLQSPGLFQSIQNSPSLNNPAYSTGRQFAPQTPQNQFKAPQWQPGTPQYSPRTPQIQTQQNGFRTPQQPRAPQFPTGATHCQPRTPQHQQNWQPRTPQYQHGAQQNLLPRTPQHQPRAQQNLQPRTPHHQTRAQQNLQPRTPQHQPRVQQNLQPMSSHQPGAQQNQWARTPHFQQKTTEFPERMPQHQNGFHTPQNLCKNMPVPPPTKFDFRSPESVQRSPLQDIGGNSSGAQYDSLLDTVQNTPRQTKSKWSFKSRNSPTVHLAGETVIASDSTDFRVTEDSCNNLRANDRLSFNSEVNAPIKKNPRLNFEPVSVSSLQRPNLGPVNVKHSAHSAAKAINLQKAAPASHFCMTDVDSLWHDDLTDELLTELTGDDFP